QEMILKRLLTVVKEDAPWKRGRIRLGFADRGRGGRRGSSTTGVGRVWTQRLPSTQPPAAGSRPSLRDCRDGSYLLRTDSAPLTFFRQRIADFQPLRPERASLTAELGRLCPQGP